MKTWMLLGMIWSVGCGGAAPAIGLEGDLDAGNDARTVEKAREAPEAAPDTQDALTGRQDAGTGRDGADEDTGLDVETSFPEANVPDVWGTEADTNTCVPTPYYEACPLEHGCVFTTPSDGCGGQYNCMVAPTCASLGWTYGTPTPGCETQTGFNYCAGGTCANDNDCSSPGCECSATNDPGIEGIPLGGTVPGCPNATPYCVSKRPVDEN
jgi:hypothetical protein